jgi:hypothetical protein
MPVDISGLQLRDLNPDERVDYTKGYEAAGEFQPPPPEGQYILQTTAVKAAKTPNKEGFLAVDIEASVAPDVNKAGVGYRIFQSSASVKKYKNRNGSPVDDYLRSHGITLTFPAGTTTPVMNAETAQALSATEGRFAPVNLSWEGYCKDCDEAIKGEDSFPKNQDGSRSYRKPCAHCKKDVLARARVSRWVSTVVAQGAGSISSGSL